jgi:hypothetical protein
MKPITATALVVLGLASGAAVLAASDKRESSATPKKKVLVELYTSQGCDSCPPASEFFGQLAELGYGPDQIVPIGFHVAYFNDPWVDPYSDPLYSRRQASYNAVNGRSDLYFTPMMMVDGRIPMLGSDRAKARAAIAQSLKEPPGLALALKLDRSAERVDLTVELTPKSPRVVGRDVLVGVAVTEDPLSTDVLSGENAGKTLVEHHVVRAFTYKSTRLARSEATTLSFPIKDGSDWVAEHCRLAVFVQDKADGRVYQAEAIPWAAGGRDKSPTSRPLGARRRSRSSSSKSPNPSRDAPQP